MRKRILLLALIATAALPFAAAEARTDISVGVALPGLSLLLGPGRYAPPVVYAPPRVVYAPPPAYYGPTPAYYPPRAVVYGPPVRVHGPIYNAGYYRSLDRRDHEHREGRGRYQE